MTGSASQPTASEVGAWRAFLTVHARVFDVLERELVEAVGLPLTWYDVLVQLSEAKERRLRMHTLAGLVLLSRAGLTRLVDRMAAAGLVERERAPEDRRGTYVVMTAAGQRALREASPTHLQGVKEHFIAPLTSVDVTAVAEAMHKILAAQPPPA